MHKQKVIKLGSWKLYLHQSKTNTMMECVIGHKIDYIGVGVVRDPWRRPFSNQSEANIYRDLLIRRSLRASSTVRRRVPAYFGGLH